MLFILLLISTLLNVNAGEGHTWSEEVTLFDTPIDDRDAGIICSRKNTIIVSWFNGPYEGKWQGNWII